MRRLQSRSIVAILVLIIGGALISPFATNIMADDDACADAKDDCDKYTKMAGTVCNFYGSGSNICILAQAEAGNKCAHAADICNE